MTDSLDDLPRIDPPAAQPNFKSIEKIPKMEDLLKKSPESRWFLQIWFGRNRSIKIPTQVHQIHQDQLLCQVYYKNKRYVQWIVLGYTNWVDIQLQSRPFSSRQWRKLQRRNLTGDLTIPSRVMAYQDRAPRNTSKSYSNFGRLARNSSPEDVDRLKLLCIIV